MLIEDVQEDQGLEVIFQISFGRLLAGEGGEDGVIWAKPSLNPSGFFGMVSIKFTLFIYCTTRGSHLSIK